MESAITFAWRTCPHCGDVFYGRHQACMTCRMALQYGDVLVYRTEDQEAGGLPPALKPRRITRREVQNMRKPKQDAPAAPATGETNTRQRRLKRAPGPEAELLLQVRKTMKAQDVDAVFKAVSAFVAAAPQGDYNVAITIERAG